MTQEVVLIAGAGPVGLTAAHRIARHGAPVRIIDVANEPTQLSKSACGVEGAPCKCWIRP